MIIIIECLPNDDRFVRLVTFLAQLLSSCFLNKFRALFVPLVIFKKQTIEKI